MVDFIKMTQIYTSPEIEDKRLLDTGDMLRELAISTNSVSDIVSRKGWLERIDFACSCGKFDDNASDDAYDWYNCAIPEVFGKLPDLETGPDDISPYEWVVKKYGNYVARLGVSFSYAVSENNGRRAKELYAQLKIEKGLRK